MTSACVRKGPDSDGLLHERAFEHFGGWVAAVEKAGVKYDSLRPPKGRYPTREAVLDGIRRRHEAGLPLNSKAIDDGKDGIRDKALFMSALRRFGSWGKAVQASGMDYAGVCQRTWARTRKALKGG